MVEDTRILSVTEMSPKNLVFSNISFTSIFTEITLSEGIKVRKSPAASENLANNQRQLENGAR